MLLTYMYPEFPTLLSIIEFETLKGNFYTFYYLLKFELNLYGDVMQSPHPNIWRTTKGPSRKLGTIIAILNLKRTL